MVHYLIEHSLSEGIKIWFFMVFCRGHTLDVPWTEKVWESLTWLLNWKMVCYVMYSGSRKLYWIRLCVNFLLCLQVVNVSAHLVWWSTSRIILLNNSFRFKNLEANKWPKQSKTFFFFFLGPVITCQNLEQCLSSMNENFSFSPWFGNL